MSKNTTENTESKFGNPDLVKRIGNTTYKVNIHFNPDARETLRDKILRMLKNEVRQSTKL